MDAVNSNTVEHSSQSHNTGNAPAQEQQATAMEKMAMERHMFELSSIHQSSRESNGSILAIVCFPEDAGFDCNGYAYKPRYELRVDYARLMATRSAKIQALLDPRNQKRVRRRYNLDVLPDGVRYVIDLTPPQEGVELADLTASLWLPPGTKLWYLAGHYRPDSILEQGPDPTGLYRRALAAKAVGAVLALGHDDRCSCIETNFIDRESLWKSTDVPGIFPGHHVPKYRQLRDYCDVRHRVNIMRLLRAVNGVDLLVNSATRMWTLVQTAIHLEITSVVRDSVAQWFLAAPNSKFIEIYPEETFRVALALKLPDVLVAAFTILVNETAIDLAATNPPVRRPSHTWIQRKRGDYGDMPQDPVEYAATAFFERIKNKLEGLRGDSVFDDLGISEWKKLKCFGEMAEEVSKTTASSLVADLLACHKKLVDGLLTSFRIIVNDSLWKTLQPTKHIAKLVEAQREHYLPKASCRPLLNLYDELNEHQKALCPFFWQGLRDNSKRLRYAVPQQALGTLETFFNRRLKDAYNSNVLSENDARLFDFDSDYPSLIFSLANFETELDFQIQLIHMQILGTDRAQNDGGPPMYLSDHLIRHLDENELKFLPIWAGGFDDGSGGVFQEQIPPTEMGPSEPGPAYHTGWTIGSTATTDTDNTDAGTLCDTMTVSDMGFSNLDIQSGTAARSIAVQNSESTMGTHSRVLTGPSEGFTTTSEEEFAHAMIMEPAAHQDAGQALEVYVEAHQEDGHSEGLISMTASESGSQAASAVPGSHDEDDDMKSDSTLSAMGGSDDEDDWEYDLVNG